MARFDRLTDAIARFAAFVAGSFVAVLLLATVIDPDLFIHLEITPHGSVLFYLSLFGGILAVARGMIPEENKVFDSEVLMEAIVQYTHFLPDEWREQLHSKAVHTQFGELFAMKAVTFATELASVVLTPFVLWFALPSCAPAIVDFFREFTVHVDGLGYVCSFAVFDFQRHGNVKVGFPLPFPSSLINKNAAPTVWCTYESFRREADVQRREDGEVLCIIQGSASGVDASGPIGFTVSLAYRRSLRAAGLRRSDPSPQRSKPHTGVRACATRVANRSGAPARRRRIWHDVDGTWAIDGDGIPIRYGAERFARRFGWIRRCRELSTSCFPSFLFLICGGRRACSSEWREQQWQRQRHWGGRDRGGLAG